jgi:hypothetical protein
MRKDSLVWKTKSAKIVSVGETPVIGHNTGQPSLSAKPHSSARVRVTPPVQPPQEPSSPDAQRIAATLTEPNAWLIQRVIATLGLTRVEALLQETLAVEAQGGLLTDDQQRRRTPGGVFFKLVKAHTTPAERQAIFPHLAPSKRKNKQPPSIPATAADAGAGVPWAEVPTVVTELLKPALGAATVKLTLVGRPLQVKELPSYLAVALHGQAPPTLPKGLPTPPAGAAMRLVVFMAHKQWNGVKESLAHNLQDKLVVQGYPVFDPKTGTTVVLAQQVQSVEQQKAQKATRKNTPNGG